MAGFDQRCPMCGTVHDDLWSAWESNDYGSDFECHCDKCDRWFSVIVHQVPEFETKELTCVKCHRAREFNKHYCTKCEKEFAK